MTLTADFNFGCLISQLNSMTQEAKKNIFFRFSYWVMIFLSTLDFPASLARNSFLFYETPAVQQFSEERASRRGKVWALLTRQGRPVSFPQRSLRTAEWGAGAFGSGGWTWVIIPPPRSVRGSVSDVCVTSQLLSSCVPRTFNRGNSFPTPTPVPVTKHEPQTHQNLTKGTSVSQH